jgi:molybdopterin molybdotransferase
MEIEVQLSPAPIAETACWAPAGAGAWVEFRGVVRGDEAGEPIAALEYQAYSPMAEREMRRIAAELGQRHPCLAVRVVHRVGIVAVGETAIRVGIAGRHRAEAFALLGAFMDRLKQDVPIWKVRALNREAPEGVQSGSDSKAADPAEAGVAAPSLAAVAGERAELAGGGSAATADAVVALVGALCRPLEAEGVALAEAQGRVLSEPVRAAEDQPPFDRSAVDGYAVRIDDGSTAFRIVDAIRAGEWKPRPLQPGEAVRVATGAALPGAGLQVVMQEDARVEGDRLVVPHRDAARHIRGRGEDARAGDVLVEAGTVLGAGALGLLAGLGVARPPVRRLPRVLHVATGDEIVPPDQAPAAGQIRDSNSTLVRAFLTDWGILPQQCRAGEDAASVRAALGSLEPGAGPPPDLLLVSGGASVGDHDWTQRVFAELGFAMRVHRTAVRPGKPLLVAQRSGTLAFGLPGNPLAHFVCLNLYVRAALEAWAGRSPALKTDTGRLVTELASDSRDREVLWPAVWRQADGAVWVTPLRWKSSGDLSALATANALLRLAAGGPRLSRGSAVEFVRTARCS